MKKVKVTETELITIIKTMINEQEEGSEGGGTTGAKTWESGLSRGPANPAGSIGKWNDAYAWGDWSTNGLATTNWVILQNYLTAELDPVFTNWLVNISLPTLDGNNTFTGTNTFDEVVYLGTDAVGGQEAVSHQVMSNYFNSFSGGGTLQLIFKFSAATTDSDPGSGKFNFDSVVQEDSTYVYVNDVTDGGFASQPIISLLESGDVLFIQEKGEPSRAHLFLVTNDVIDAVGYSKIPVAIQSTYTNDFSNNKSCAFVLAFSVSVSSDISFLLTLNLFVSLLPYPL